MEMSAISFFNSVTTSYKWTTRQGGFDCGFSRLEGEEAAGICWQGDDAGPVATGARLGRGEQCGDLTEFGADAADSGDYGFGRRRGLGSGFGFAGLGLGASANDLKSLTGPGDGVALAVDETLDFDGEFDFAAAVEALAGSTLVGLELGELGFPEAENVGLDAADAGHVTDFEVEPVGDGG